MPRRIRAANGYKQAQVCFKEISKIVKQLDPKRGRLKRHASILSGVRTSSAKNPLSSVSPVGLIQKMALTPP